MRRTLKKLLAPALALFLGFAAMTGAAQPVLAAEGAEALVDEVDLDTLTNCSEMLLQAFAGMSADELALQEKLYSLDGNETVANAMKNYAQQTEDLGAFQEIVSGSSEKTKDGYLTTIVAQYENKTMKAEIGYDEDLPYRLIISGNSAYLDSLTDTTFTPAASIGENAFSGLANMIVGMGTVFVVLIFFTWVIGLLKYANVFDKSKAKEAEAQPKAVPAPTAQPPLPLVQPKEELSDDSALVAVITAAILAYEAESGDVKVLENGLKIRSIKRHKNSGWKR